MTEPRLQKIELEPVNWSFGREFASTKDKLEREILDGYDTHHSSIKEDILVTRMSVMIDTINALVVRVNELSKQLEEQAKEGQK